MLIRRIARPLLSAVFIGGTPWITKNGCAVPSDSAEAADLIDELTDLQRSGNPEHVIVDSEDTLQHGGR